MDSLPDPAKHKDRKIQGPEGKFISDGTRWIPINE